MAWKTVTKLASFQIEHDIPRLLMTQQLGDSTTSLGKLCTVTKLASF